MILKNKGCVNEHVCVSACVCMYWLTEERRCHGSVQSDNERARILD